MSYRWGWLLGIAIACGNLSWANSASAQISPDTTLPNNSIVTPQGQIFNITGGTTVKNNLFHSFQQFSVPTGGTAFFNNALDISNIIGRVTGNSISNIDGLIRANGTANVFLLNPNGIIFGNNASLNVGGSFVGSTANAIQFGTLGIFSATTPNAPTPLLTINPSALLFLQPSPAAITNSSTAPAGVNLAGVEVTGLRVPDGRSLLLVGGDVNIDGGSLRAYNGRIELAGLAAPGNIGLDFTENILSLGVPNVQRANVSLINGAELNVRGSDAGAIAINAQNVSLAGASKVRAGIATGLGTPESKAGDVDINATGATTLSDGSFIANVLQNTSVGKGGNINITTGSFALINGSVLNTSTFGQGDAGNISIQARDAVSLSFANIFNNIESGGVGNGGNINITAPSLTLTDGSQLQAGLRTDAQNNLPGGRGNGGNINIDVSGVVNLLASGIFADVENGAQGNGGNINIKSGSLSLGEGTVINARTAGKGNAGNIFVQARDAVSLKNASIFSAVNPGAVGNGGNITIHARNTVTFDNSFAFNDVFRNGVGKGGNIQVTTGTLSLINGSQLSSNVSGQGDAGNITVDARDAVNLDGIVEPAISGIQSSLLTNGVGKGGDIRVTTGSLSVTNGASLATSSDGRGNAGNIIINARDTVTFDGLGSDKGLPSNANSTVGSNGVGNGGEIQVNARALFLKNSGQINATSFGQGNAGKITIDTRDIVSFDGVGSNGLSSGAFTLGSNGNGGDIQVTTGTLSLTNGGELSTFARGNAGNITVNARDAINFDGVGSDGLPSGAISLLLSGGVGRGGDIQVTTGSLSVTNGAQLASYTGGKGNGGNITIDARDAIAFNGIGSNGRISGAFSNVASSGVGRGGDIQLTSGSLSLANQAQINSATSGVGRGGDIQLTSGSLSLANQAQINSGTSGQGDAGNISLNVDNAISLNNSLIRAAVSPGGVGKAGNIDILTRSLSLTNGAEIDSVLLRSPNQLIAGGRGSGGNIRINASDSLTLSGASDRGFSSGIFTTSDRGTSGPAGNIIISTDKFAVRDGGIVSALTSNPDNGGNITLNARTFEALNGGQVTTSTRSSGNAGTIKLNVRDRLTLAGSDPNYTQRIAQVEQRLRQPGETDQLGDVVINEGAASGIFATTAVGSTGNGGSIFIDPRQVTIRDGAKISVNSDGKGNAGNITLQAGTLTLDNGASISAQTAGSQGGNINLQLKDVLVLRRGSQISTTAGTAEAGGNGGNITINTPFIIAVPKENSDIAANAFSGNGGNVNIRAQGIYGIEARSQPTLESDITASSQFGLSGEVIINTPDIDPSQGLVELPAGVVNVPRLISSSCAAFDKKGSEFIVTGRGGLPPSPDDFLSGDVVWSDDRGIPKARSAIATITQQPAKTSVTSPASKPKAIEIIPATGWVFNNQTGEVTLISSAPNASNSGFTPPSCSK
ncbi:MAG: filamentous hemagglutinin N-terminal domain-containing protein [Hassallia sp.]